MAVTSKLRPYGYFIPTSSSVAVDVVSDNGTGDAVFTVTAGHGLTTGNVVYIESDIEDYCGFYSVSVGNPSDFRISKLDETDFAPFFSNVAASFTITSGNHKWNCVQLPIVYKLSNNLWPTNSADTVRDITAVTDSNGYCDITAAGDIKATGSAAALEYVKITGCADDSLNGVWQIITYSSDTSFVIDMPYSAATNTDLTTNASVQYYYNNYHVKVKIYGGLNSGHHFTAQRPYELLATLDLIPDEDGVCMFSINEYLKKHIQTRNKLLLGTLPNNLDFWTQFYITYAEAYDDSDGTTLSVTISSYTDDSSNFQGFAVNLKPPFKSVHAGSLSEYVDTVTPELVFLTLFNEPVLFSGKHYDISVIIPFSGIGVQLRQKYYLNNALQTTVDKDITTTSFDEGLYRIILDDPSCNYDEVRISLLTNGTSDAIVNGAFTGGILTPWANAGSGQAWSNPANTARVTVTGVQTSKRLEQAFTFVKGCTYKIDYNRIVASIGADSFFLSALLSNDDATLTQGIDSVLISANSGSTTETGTVVANNNYTKIYFVVNPNIP